MSVRPLRPIFAGVLLVSLAACGVSEEPRQNLILISLDTCRADRLSLYGARRPNTPRLDRFAEDAAVFEDCLAQSALTAPSHLSMLTGHYVHRHGLLNNQGSAVPPYTLASELRRHGWRTAAFTGHGSFRSAQGLDFGFETFQSCTGDEAATVTRDLVEVLPEALAWLDDVGAAPFFLLVHAYDPHCPFVPPKRFAERYGGWYTGSFDPDGLCHPKAFGELIRDGTIGVEELRYLNDLYDAEIASADVALGGFFDELERRDLLESSIVVFTSDHGEVLGKHGWVGHGQVWEEALRVPFLIRFPGGRWAGRYDEAVQLIDLPSTLLSALGVPTPEGMQGIDLVPLLRGESDPVPPDRMRVARVGDEPNQTAVRFGERWKIIFGESDGVIRSPSLRDLEKDPHESKNFAQTPDGQERFERILDRYLSWRESTASEDARFRGQIGSSLESDEDVDLMRALGYVDDDE